MSANTRIDGTPSASHSWRKTPVKTTTRTIAVAAIVGTAAATAISVPATAATEIDAPLLMPYYTDLDLTGDAQVTTADLDVATAALGTVSTDAGWADVSVIDLDEDGEITVVDIAGLSQRMVYDDGPFDLIEADVIEMQAAMNAGVTTSVEITTAYLDRIAAYDTVAQGEEERALNSIISTSDVALDAAAAADAERAAEGMTSMLLGVPIALKDNYNTYDMPTTAGCGCWDDNQTDSDATMVEGLRDAGAVILAKASLDEFAYGFTSQFSAFQEAGETTYIASPYFTNETAGGSSGGTGAAIAANLAGIGFGTDTGGSIRVPSSYNALVGIRPTVGLTSRDGIVPLALSQDTGGPMARSVLDAAVALDATIGIDEGDPITANQAGLTPESYTEALDPEALDGARIGYIPVMVDPSSAGSSGDATTIRLFGETVDTMEAEGATVIELEQPEWFLDLVNEGSGSTNEFRHDLEEYVDAYLAPEVAARTIPEIIESGRFVTSRERTYERRAEVTEEDYDAWAGPEGSHTAILAQGKIDMHALLEEYDLDAIIYPSGQPYGTQWRNLRLSPNTGMPTVTLPMGQSIEGEELPGANVNIEILGRDYDEATILGLAYSFEQATEYRTTPALYPALD
ncbi:amidase family protein [Microbacterium aquimaris]|uniref:Amidase family protein n=1 Tax=Microbacterium aquimaris TaxID=459816 RepID=A0ABU5N4Z2_9MICO|nr:amidase family protein [Microbacterium aquimaris]MDZ8161156.1 amidase family protein [Microbacterium aquimaris]